MARARGDGKVPGAVTVRLAITSDYGSTTDPAVATRSATTQPTGAFVTSIPLVGLPEGTYAIQMLVGEKVLRTLYVTVGPIAKPAYHLDVATGHHVYVAGDRIKITVGAEFFEGTPVPGVPLRIGGEIERDATTGEDGSAVATLVAKPEESQEGPSYRTVEVSPAREEEGEIDAASGQFLVFASTRVLDSTARIASGKVDVRGSVHALARDRLEREIASGKPIWDLDARGSAIGGATVLARFTEVIPVRRPSGTHYDFIQKKVVPVVDIELVDHAAGSLRARTAADGSFHLVLPDAVKGHDYRIVLSVGDPDGHVEQLTVGASSEIGFIGDRVNPSLRLTDPAAVEGDPYRVGDPIDLTMVDPEATATDGSRYLFFTTQQGIRSALVQGSPRFTTRFAAWAPPNIDIGAVRWTGREFVGAVTFAAQFRTEDRRLGIQLTPGATRYAPGETATVAVRTTDADGAPTAATVILRAVDEKLFSIAAAEVDDPLNDLYVPLASAIVGTYASHHSPRPGFEGGDTTGGGGDDRNDFRDSLLFQAITTGADGRGTREVHAVGRPDVVARQRDRVHRRTSRPGRAPCSCRSGCRSSSTRRSPPSTSSRTARRLVVRTFGTALAAGAPVTIEVYRAGARIQQRTTLGDGLRDDPRSDAGAQAGYPDGDDLGHDRDRLEPPNRSPHPHVPGHR